MVFTKHRDDVVVPKAGARIHKENTMKKFLISAAAAATLIGGSFALAAWSPMGTAGAQEGDTSTMDHTQHEDGGSHRGARGGQRLGVVAESLGIDAEELRAQLVNGATLAEIAGDGVDALVADLVAQATEHAAEAVEAGKIDQAQADEMLAGVEAKITERINTVMTPGDHAGHRLEMAPGLMPSGMGDGHDGSMRSLDGSRMSIRPFGGNIRPLPVPATNA